MATTTRILDANVNGTVYTANANDALEALDTCHSGTTAPTDEVANGKFWLDTSTTPSVLKVYDNAGWNVVYSGRGDLTVAGTVNATALTGNGAGITGVATAAQGALADSAVQPNDSPTFGTVTATSYAGDGSALTGIPLPPSQTTAVWEAGTDTTESTVSAAKVAAAITALADPLDSIAGAAFGVVGTHAFAYLLTNEGTINPGDTFAGSLLRPVSLRENSNFVANVVKSTATLSGTWMALGYASSNTYYAFMPYKRIS